MDSAASVKVKVQMLKKFVFQYADFHKFKTNNDVNSYLINCMSNV